MTSSHHASTHVADRIAFARFDADIWYPARCSPYDSFLEIGCGDGTFLSYLAERKVTRFLGIDPDPALAEIIPPAVRGHFSCRDAWQLLADGDAGPYDRVILTDILELLTPDDGIRLLETLRPRLNEGARVVIKVPNAASPWSLQERYGDLIHRTAFTPQSLRQLAEQAGYRVAGLWPERHGSWRRRFTDGLVHRFLSWALLNPPPLWSANFYAMLAAR